MMNTTSKVIYALISISFLLAPFCLASQSVEETVIKSGAKLIARNCRQNRNIGMNSQLLSRYYGALSPQGETGLILDQVQDLINSGNLSQKTGIYLQVMLKAAKNKFDQDNDDLAVSHLQVFIHLVEDFVLHGKISKEDGQELIENTQLLIEALQT